MPRLVRPPSSVLLVVGREDFAPPRSFAGSVCVATQDCVAIAVVDVQESATSIRLTPDAVPGLSRLGEFRIETEGLVSVRDLHYREHESVGVPPGWATVTVWGDATEQPSEIALQVVAVPGD